MYPQYNNNKQINKRQEKRTIGNCKYLTFLTYKMAISFSSDNSKSYKQHMGTYIPKWMSNYIFISQAKFSKLFSTTFMNIFRKLYGEEALRYKQEFIF
jgi:hypothetical protein